METENTYTTMRYQTATGFGNVQQYGSDSQLAESALRSYSSFLRFECVACRSPLDAPYLLHEDVWDVAVCPKCGALSYLVKLRIGRLRGCNTYALDKIPESLMGFVQPDRYYVDPQECLRGPASDESRGDPEEEAARLDEAKCAIARRRNAIPPDQREAREAPLRLLAAMGDDELYGIMDRHHLENVTVSTLRRMLVENARFFDRASLSAVVKMTVTDLKDESLDEQLDPYDLRAKGAHSDPW